MSTRAQTSWLKKGDGITLWQFCIFSEGSPDWAFTQRDKVIIEVNGDFTVVGHKGGGKKSTNNEHHL